MAGLSVAQQLHAHVGDEEAVKWFAQPALRDTISVLPMEWVTLDGRTKDFWALDGAGKPRRYKFLTLVDCATNFVLDWELAESENARATVRLIRRVCQPIADLCRQDRRSCPAERGGPCASRGT